VIFVRSKLKSPYQIAKVVNYHLIDERVKKTRHYYVYIMKNRSICFMKVYMYIYIVRETLL